MRLFYVSMLLLWASSLSAQVNVRGTVQDQGGEPLPGATVQIVNSVTGTAADIEGRYALRLPVGDVRIVFSFLGFGPVDTLVSGRYGDTIIMNVTMREQLLTTPEVLVTARLARGQAQALELQRTGLTVQNIIHSDVFNRYPDVTVGETVQRLPAVSITRSRGEGEFVQVRGLPEQYVAIAMDGQRLPSVQAEADRAAGLDFIQSNLIDEVRLIKTLTPDMDGDAIAGTLDFRLKQPQERTVAVGQLGYGINQQASEVRDLNRRIIQGAVYLNQNFAEDKLNLLFAGSYLQTGRGTLLETFRYTPGDDTEALDWRSVTDFDNSRRRYGIIGAVEYRPSIYHRLRLSYNVNGFIDEEIRRDVNYRFDENLEDRLTANFRQKRSVSLTTMNVESNYGRFRLDYGVSFADARDELPDRLFYRFSRPNSYTGIDTEDRRQLTATSTFNLPPLDLQGVNIDVLRTDESIFNGSLNMTFQLNRNGTSNIKLGGRFRGSERFVGATFDQAVPTQPYTIDSGEFGFPGLRFGSEEFARLALDPTFTVDLYNNPAAYEAAEGILAGYVMNTTNWTGRLTSVIGARLERTNYNFRQLTTEETAADSYDNLLPSVNLTYRFTKYRQLRLAYYEGINRPPYATLVPFEVSRSESGLVTRGNTDVLPVQARNFDLMYERYGSRESVFSVGFFAKWLDNPYFTTAELAVRDNLPITILTFQNGDRAEVLGAEMSFYQNLAFIRPGLRHFNLNGNYSYNESRLIDAVLNLEGELPLARSPRHIANLSLVYNDASRDVSIVLAGVYRHFAFDRLQDGEPVYLNANFNLDLAADYQITDHLGIYLRLNNLTNQKAEEFLGSPRADDSRLFSSEEFGIWGAVGVRLRTRRNAGFPFSD